MPRADLLALTAEDLIALTNRGTVKRAQKELEAGEPQCHIDEAGDGGVMVAWSDGITCRFLPGKTIHDAVCSSGSAGISRHVVRSVLAYQRAAVAAPSSPDEVALPPPEHGPVVSSAASVRPGQVWDPGRFTDDELIRCFRKPAVDRARTRFAQGVLVELTRGAKPVARFLDEACTVRFAVPGDLRYASADCSESLWPTWISQAVWAFRELPADQLSGLIALQRAAPEVPTDVFRDLHALLDELCRDGLAGVAPSWTQRLFRAEQKLRDEGCVWLAELGLEISQQHDMYQGHDARFDPDQVVLLVGELLARMRAISRNSTPVPQPLIRGTKSDRPTDIDGGRFTGVGLGIHPGRRHTTLRAYLQEANTGTVVAVGRTFADPGPDSTDLPKPYADLAAASLVRGVSVGGLAMSQLLLQSGKRTPGGQLVLPRSASSLTIHPQNFQWEQLKAPFAAEGFAQLRARLRFLPPSYLRPRRFTENLHGIAVVGADHVQFDVARQQLTARLRDAQGDTAILVHPFHNRGAAGFNALVRSLQQHGAQIRFVCGHMRASSQGLVINPVLLIADDGSRRIGINPWLENQALPASSETFASAEGTPGQTAIRPEVDIFLAELQQSLADVLLTGLARDAAHARSLAERTRQCRRLGFAQLADLLASLSDDLATRSNTLRWDAANAVVQLQHLCVIFRIAVE